MKKIDFNRGWHFRKVGHEKEGFAVDLPHDAMLTERRDAHSPTGNGCAYFEGGTYIYDKQFVIPPEWDGLSKILFFEGVYKDAQVLVNGVKLTERPYGYSEFEVDITEHVTTGSNEIRVVADNSRVPNSRWYSGAGIYREVSLFVGDVRHIKLNGVKVRTLCLEPAQIEVSIETTAADGLLLETEILFKNEPVAKAQGSHLVLDIPKARLWDAEHPDLYTCRVRLSDGDRQLDMLETRFGIRMLQWSNKGFFVNGAETLLKGACIHHDNGLLGACQFREAEYRKVRLLKEAGFNAIRSSHNPVGRATLDACDEYGMYVVDETFDQWFQHKNKYDYASVFKDWWRADTRTMIEKDFNHPCVILYSIGNEVSETALPEGIAQAEEIARFVRELDPSRPVTTAVSLMLNAMVSKGLGLYREDKSASDGLNNLSGSAFVNFAMAMTGKVMNLVAASPFADAASAGVFSKVDIAGYNYGLVRYEKDAKKYPERILLGSETMPPELYDNWQKVKKLPALIGDFMWTGWDYIGESGIAVVSYSSWYQAKNNPPLLLGGPGVIDITGMPRPEVWMNRAIYGEKNICRIGVEPVIYAKDRKGSSPWRKTDAIHSWAWNGCEGRMAKILVYTDGDTVKLYLNDQPVGTKKVRKCKAEFRVRFEPGTLKAVSYREGIACAEDILYSAGAERHLTVQCEKERLKADGQDLAYLDIAITDESGNIRVMDDRAIAVKVSGDGVLQALGSADPHTDEGFLQPEHRSYYGRAQAIVRALDTPGNITVEISAEGMPSVTRKIITE